MTFLTCSRRLGFFPTLLWWGEIPQLTRLTKEIHDESRDDTPVDELQ